MERPDNLQPDERQLWGRYAALAGNGPAVACPSPNLLAALVDNDAGPGLDEEDRAALERHVAACSACRAAVDETRTLIVAQRESPIAVPPEVIARAKTLVPLPVLTPVVVGRLDLRRFGRWGLSAAASIAVCLVGYQAGAHSSEAVVTESDLVTELTFGVDIDETAEFDLFLATDGASEVGS